MDCYAILNLKFGAVESDIKKSFYDLAKKFHPDQAVDACEELQLINKEKFQRVNAAYEILGDPDKKEKYDAIYAAKFMRPPAELRGVQSNRMWE